MWNRALWESLIAVFASIRKIFILAGSLGTKTLKKKQTLWPLFMDEVQLPQGYSHFEEAVYFLPFSSQKFLVLILSTSEGWKAESTLEPPSGLEHGTPGLGIQRLEDINQLIFLFDFLRSREKVRDKKRIQP